MVSKTQDKKMGAGARVGLGTHFIGPHNIVIGQKFSCWRNCTIAACDDGVIEFGDRVSFNANVYINACIGGRIVLGNDVLVAPNVVMRASDHVFDDVTKPIAEQGHTGREIIVEYDVWLSSNVTVVGGVRIGKGAVVAAGAVVTKDVAPYTVVGGVPARFIKNRGED
jgi:galactoside O-acetyltransferase